MPITKITVINTSYEEKRDLVQWLVQEVETGKRRILAWPGSDLGPAVGIDRHLPPDLIRQFCDDIKGKTINIEAIPDVKDIDPKKLKDMGEEDLLKEHQVFDKYPYAEVLASLEEQGQFKDARKKVPKRKGRYMNLRDVLDES